MVGETAGLEPALGPLSRAGRPPATILGAGPVPAERAPSRMAPSSVPVTGVRSAALAGVTRAGPGGRPGGWSRATPPTSPPFSPALPHRPALASSTHSPPHQTAPRRPPAARPLRAGTPPRLSRPPGGRPSATRHWATAGPGWLRRAGMRTGRVPSRTIILNFSSSARRLRGRSDRGGCIKIYNILNLCESAPVILISKFQGGRFLFCSTKICNEGQILIPRCPVRR